MSDWILVPVFFVVSGLALYGAARGYVVGLLFVGRHGRISKFVGGALLWLGFGAIAITPLFAFLIWANRRGMSMPYLVWGLLWYGVSTFLPVVRGISSRIGELRAVRFFLK